MPPRTIYERLPALTARYVAARSILRLPRFRKPYEPRRHGAHGEIESETTAIAFPADCFGLEFLRVLRVAVVNAFDLTSFMSCLFKALPNLLAPALVGLLSVPITAHAEPPAPAAVEAQFRGCAAAGWCRFWIEPTRPSGQSLYCVRPDGVMRAPGDAAISIAVRDRLNALLANMIHQAKHIVLHDLRELNDGTFAATVTVNGVDLASDPALLELREKGTSTIR